MNEASPLDDAFARICQSEAPLGERLALFTAAVAEHSKPFAAAYDRLVAQVSGARAGSSAPAIGEAMPRLLLPDHCGRLVSLDDLLDEGPLVLSFNRGHWCEYCQLEMRAFAAAHGEFVARGAKVVCVMPERAEHTLKLRALTNDTVTVLSDIDNGYALTVGVVMWLGDEVTTLYRKFGLHIDRYQGNANWFVPIPATFVLDRNGIVLDRQVDPDFRRRMDIAHIIETLDSAT